MLIASVIIWLVTLLFLKLNRIWIFYFIWGAVGSTILLILILRGTYVEFAMEQMTGFILHELLYLLSIQSYIFDNAPGTVLVLLEIENSWSTIDIDIECSGLLETCVFLGLLIFYPSFATGRRMFFLVSGMVGIYVINLVRLIIIVLIMSYFGRDSIFIAHTLFGRMIFFGLLILIYWLIFTRASLLIIKEHKND
ncbi:MAG: hypothetical protein JL50_15145 [Peptococcaceae bacterium BICA1-7]|nr:MAG: hypothetical protein JL50_15145 [Peptococcaceae bacterium BICA1-7]HBV96878.1 exosortase family protein XrtG [Desulfotomaculum sp.]